MKKPVRDLIEAKRKLKRRLGRPPLAPGQKKPKKVDPDKLPANAGEPARPTKYTKELGDRICEIVATTAMPLRKLCDTYKDFPGPTMLYRWLRKHEEFRASYRQARIDQSTVLVDELLELADTERLGQVVIQKEDGTRYIRAGDMIGRTKLQITTRQWLLARLDPKSWGAKLDVTDNTNPLKNLLEGWESRYKEITKDERPADSASDEEPSPAG